MIKRASKWTFIIYIFGFLISVAHFPQGVWRIARDGDARVLLAPLAMPSVLRVYGQFICAAVWPYGDDVQTVTLEELIRVHGVKPFERNPNINVVTVTVDNGLDARPVSYFLSNEFYDAYERNGGSWSGNIIKVGRFFCPSNPYTSFVEIIGNRRDCISFVRKGEKLFWQKLGDPNLLRVTYGSH